MRLIFFPILILVILFTSCRGKAIVFDDTKINHITKDLIIETKDSLVIKPGAEILIDTGVNILAYGTVLIQGTKEKPIKIKASDPDYGWGEFRAKGECPKMIIENAEIEEGQFFSYKTENYFKNVVFRSKQQLEWNDAIARFWHGSVLIENCRIEGVNRGEGFLLHDVEKPIIRNSYFTKIPDAIEFINCNDGVISGNEFLFMKDDAIDQNSCKRTRIENNRIFYVKDCGMELGSEKFGSSDSLFVFNNLIVGCLKGIIVKESSKAILTQNTFYNNEIGIEINTHADSSRVSSVEIRHSAFKGNKTNFIKNQKSELIISQSVSDSIPLPGKENIISNFNFENLEKHNYKISTEIYPKSVKKGELGYWNLD